MECLQEDPETPIDSKLSMMPESVPIDWFDPEAWNSFTVCKRVEYTVGGISVSLPLEKYCDTFGKVCKMEEFAGKRIHGEIWQ